MTDFKLKINLGEASIELEGEGTLVKEILSDLKETGLGVLADKQIVEKQKYVSENKDEIKITDGSAEVTQECPEYPPIKDLIISERLNNEQEKLLVFAFYLSNYGQDVVSENAIRDEYKKMNLWSKSISGNFKSNIKKLIRDKKSLSSYGTDSYLITQDGKEYAKDIIFGASKTSETKKIKNTKITKSSIQKCDIVELNLTREDKAELIRLYSNKDNLNTIDKVLLASYWYKNNRQEVIINKDIVFTVLRNANVSVTFSIQDALGNAKKKDYYSKTGKVGEYEFSYLGEDYVTNKLLVQE